MVTRWRQTLHTKSILMKHTIIITDRFHITIRSASRAPRHYMRCIITSGDSYILSDLINITMLTFEPRHGNTGSIIFVFVIPKEGLAGISPVKPSFGMTLTAKYNQQTTYKERQWQKDGLSDMVSAKPSFVMTTTKTVRPVFAWRGSYISPALINITPLTFVLNLHPKPQSIHSKNILIHIRCMLQKRILKDLCRCHTL